MPPTFADRLRHILDAINDIDEILRDKTFESFRDDRFVRVATERLLEIISEASRHIPADVKARESGIPWQRVADLGNRLRHAYHRVDPDILWQIAKYDLVSLREFTTRIIREAKE